MYLLSSRNLGRGKVPLYGEHVLTGEEKKLTLSQSCFAPVAQCDTPSDGRILACNRFMDANNTFAYAGSELAHFWRTFSGEEAAHEALASLEEPYQTYFIAASRVAQSIAGPQLKARYEAQLSSARTALEGKIIALTQLAVLAPHEKHIAELKANIEHTVVSEEDQAGMERSVAILETMRPTLSPQDKYTLHEWVNQINHTDRTFFDRFQDIPDQVKARYLRVILTEGFRLGRTWEEHLDALDRRRESSFRRAEEANPEKFSKPKRFLYENAGGIADWLILAGDTAEGVLNFIELNLECAAVLFDALQPVFDYDAHYSCKTDSNAERNFCHLFGYAVLKGCVDDAPFVAQVATDLVEEEILDVEAVKQLIDTTVSKQSTEAVYDVLHTLLG
ncbi:hypothetical protein J4460_03965 [Candidatus Woesearchaeota archaeon]|nr:hypothetical protein [Candidatus Woesearchaeota archaeon]HIH38261.1 hypothetical protein [Candidatus Woesearchaeota archaeon]HIH49165.1 hypothetical protein [Candidatus Woesearchaeota archaeon]HIJ04417.1 hypothetical protein [Candidatus Woesearchaeota archaeon]